MQWERAYLVPKRRSRVKAFQSVSRMQTSDFSKGGQRYDPILTPYKIVEYYLSLRGSSPTYQAGLLA